MSDDAAKPRNYAVMVPWILSIITVAVGLWQFTAQQQQANRLPFLQKQLELGFLASETAAQLASETDLEAWQKARVTFWKLYWGPLSIVEDRAVENAMVDLGRLVPQGAITASDLPLKALGAPSYRLAHAVRDLVLKSWNVDLPPLQGQR